MGSKLMKISAMILFGNFPTVLRGLSKNAVGLVGNCLAISVKVNLIGGSTSDSQARLVKFQPGKTLSSTVGRRKSEELLSTDGCTSSGKAFLWHRTRLSI
jgi:hypothetical protein